MCGPVSGRGLVWAGLEGDLHAGDLFELADQGTFAATLVDVGFVGVGTKVTVVRVGVGEHAPDAGEDGVADRDQCLLLAAPADTGLGPTERKPDEYPIRRCPTIAEGKRAGEGTPRGADTGSRCRRSRSVPGTCAASRG